MEDKALNYIFHDILDKVLRLSENPTQFAEFLTQQIRELIGARTVIIAYKTEKGDTNLFSVFPARRLEWCQQPEVMALVEQSVDLQTIERWNNDNANEEIKLFFAKHKIENSISIPLVASNKPVGSILLLDIMDMFGLESVIDLLTKLSPIFALIIRNSLLHFNLENLVEQRTAELVKRNEELAESEEKLTTLFASMTEMVVQHELVFDANGEALNYRITDCNNAFCKHTDIKKENAVGKLATQVYGTESAPYLEEYTRVAKTGKPYEFNTYFAPLDKYFMISVVSPAINQFATITTDISASKQIQDIIREKNKELENYMYVASHDLRSPLVNIQGFSQRFQKQMEEINQLIVASELPLETVESLNKITHDALPKTLDYIQSNVRKMDSLISGLLQISRTGRINMNISKINMYKLMQIIQVQFSFEISEQHVTMQFGNLDDCYGDEDLLNRLFSNLIGNAVKYSQDNRKLEIGISSQVKYNKVIYSIKDNGIGIKAKHLDKIWDIFYRVNTTTIGEGLGLSISKRIVDKHKGKIWVESVEGEGSTFYVELRKNKFEE